MYKNVELTALIAVAVWAAVCPSNEPRAPQCTAQAFTDAAKVMLTSLPPDTDHYRLKSSQCASQIQTLFEVRLYNTRLQCTPTNTTPTDIEFPARGDHTYYGWIYRIIDFIEQRTALMGGGGSKTTMRVCGIFSLHV